MTVNELLEWMRDRGFHGGQLEEDLRRGVSFNLPAFKIDHRITFGKEEMFFEIQFLKTQDNGYQPEKYKATHRSSIEIDHKMINGIDSAELESKFRKIDWDNYFGRARNINSTAIAAGAKTLSELSVLAVGGDFDGREIQQQLMFKYLPKHLFDYPSKQEYKDSYERSREFPYREYGMANANLVYYFLSGQYDDILEKVDKTGVLLLSDFNIEWHLNRHLSANPQQFDLRLQVSNPIDGIADFIFRFKKENGSFPIDRYTIDLTPYPPVEHGIYNGVNSKDLEQMMSSIDWKDNDKLFIFNGDDEPVILPAPAKIQEQLYQVSHDEKGARAAELLQVKYWSESDYFDAAIAPKAWDYLATLPKKRMEFSIENDDAKQSLNLISGRAVCTGDGNTWPPGTEDWIKLEGDIIRKISGYGSGSSHRLDKQLGMIPVERNFKSDRPVLLRLLRGDLVSAILNNDRIVYLQAMPEEKTISILSSDLRPVPVNLSYDPDWKQEQSLQKKMPQNKKRGLRFSRRRGF